MVMDTMIKSKGKTLYDETVHLYENRHRKLTLRRMHKETGFPMGFLTQFTVSPPLKYPERVKIFYDYLKRYKDNPDLL